MGRILSNTDIFIYGFGGLRLKNDLFRRLHKLDRKLVKSDVVVLDLGSNDLCDEYYSPALFVRDYLSYANFLQTGLGVQKVVICQLLPRLVTPYEEYNDHIILANRMLEQQVINMDITFWKHRCGLWNPTVNVYDVDGIHLSMDNGYPKYFRSIRDCIARALAVHLNL